MSSYKTLEMMMLELAADKCAISTYISNSGFFRITLSNDSLELKKENYDNAADFFDAFRALYDQYMRVTGAVPELVPHRLPPPAEPEQTEEPAYTEYTEIEEPASATNGALPTIPKDDIPF